ncbi:hypothetical protein J6590_097037 [Homalodisca vitripennis]|nr:hypothetical protein J6590_097037 [Homalodisca vitripennis]
MENWISDNLPAQTAISTMSRGWMETTLFFNWFRDVFLPNITEERPILLIYDDHTTHASPKKQCNHNEVTSSHYPCTTAFRCRLNVGFFKSLKSNWDKVLTKWQRENPRKKIPKQIFVELITNLSHEMPEQNIVSGFQATEIYDESKGGPNRLMIPETLFKKDDVVRYKKNLPTSSQFIQVKASSVSEISASPSHSVEAEASSVLITEQPKTSTSSAKTQPDTCLTSTTEVMHSAAAPTDACPLSDTMLLESSATSVAIKGGSRGGARGARAPPR